MPITGNTYQDYQQDAAAQAQNQMYRDVKALQRKGLQDAGWAPWMIDAAEGIQTGIAGSGVAGPGGPQLVADEQMRAANVPASVAGADFYSQLAMNGANAGPRANPYNAQIANQARPALSALFQQMNAQAQMPSIASMQAQGAQGANLQAALGARGPNARNAMMAGSAAGNIANEAATGGAVQQMQQLQGAGGLATGMRQRDLQSAQQQVESGLGARSLDDAQRRYYATLGTNIAQAQDQAAIENYKLWKKLQLQAQQNGAGFLKGFANTTASMMGAGG